MSKQKSYSELKRALKVLSYQPDAIELQYPQSEISVPNVQYIVIVDHTEKTYLTLIQTHNTQRLINFLRKTLNHNVDVYKVQL